jgi:hypothetical protein
MAFVSHIGTGFAHFSSFIIDTVAHCSIWRYRLTPRLPDQRQRSCRSNTGVRGTRLGSNVQSATSISATNGPSTSRPFFDRDTGGVSNRVIVGVSIGLGVPMLILVVAVLL